MSEPIFDSFLGIFKEPPTDAERQEVYGKLIRELSVVGTEAALQMLTNILSYLLWSEGIPPSGPKFEDAMTMLVRGLRLQIECLESASQKAGGIVH